jgi:two-component system, NarL family, nitrate/nitrite response regulator NarL
MSDRHPFRIRIVLADDHALLVEALTVILEPIGIVVATASDGPGLVEAVKAHQPDLVITDLSMPGGSGFAALREIRALDAPPPVIVLTVHDDHGTHQAALQAGAAGYVVKSVASTELLAAVNTVMRKGAVRRSPGLADSSDSGDALPHEGLITPRQYAVLQGLAEGLTSREIAERLGIKERTVVFHRERLRSRLGVRTPQEMLALLRRISG